jgi:hypothetical protein
MHASCREGRIAELTPSTAEEIWISEGKPEAAELMTKLCANPLIQEALGMVEGPDATMTFKSGLLIGYYAGLGRIAGGVNG